MKKNITLFGILLLTILVSGCGQNTKNNNQVNGNTQSETIQNTGRIAPIQAN